MISAARIAAAGIGFTAALSVSSVPRDGFAQGCVVTRQGAPVVGLQKSPYLEPETINVSLSYRFQYSHRHFVGDVEQIERKTEGSEVKNYLNLFDLSFTYAFSKRLNISVGIPYAVNERSSPVRDENRVVIDRYLTHAQGLGDISALAKVWVLDPDQCPDYNFSVGLGMKFPTGVYSATDVTRTFDPVTRMIRTEPAAPVDQSIQPGDGGYGAIADISGFYRSGIFGGYLAGTYIANPRGANGVAQGSTGRVMSVGDYFLARAGVTVMALDGFAVAFGGRIEGQPSKDLIGNDEGFRRPGHAISLEPGLAYGWDKTSLVVQVPIAVYRNRTASVLDEESGGHGDAAFADWFLVASLSHVF